jgi:hypothetical protein
VLETTPRPLGGPRRHPGGLDGLDAASGLAGDPCQVGGMSHTLRTFSSLGAVAAALGAGLTIHTVDWEGSQQAAIPADHSSI